MAWSVPDAVYLIWESGIRRLAGWAESVKQMELASEEKTIQQIHFAVGKSNREGSRV